LANAVSGPEKAGGGSIPSLATIESVREWHASLPPSRKPEFEETAKGSIEKGKLADLTVVSQDIMRLAPKEILSIHVLKTRSRSVWPFRAWRKISFANFLRAQVYTVTHASVTQKGNSCHQSCPATG